MRFACTCMCFCAISSALLSCHVKLHLNLFLCCIDMQLNWQWSLFYTLRCSRTMAHLLEHRWVIHIARYWLFPLFLHQFLLDLRAWMSTLKRQENAVYVKFKQKNFWLMNRLILSPLFLLLPHSLLRYGLFPGLTPLISMNLIVRR